MLNHVVHGIDPVYDQNSEILILGSFPSVKSREACFFYGHPREPLPASTKEKRNFLLRNHIAVWDVIESCDIEGSSDSSIRNAVPNNLNLILKTASIRQIYTNGGVSAKLYDKYCLPFTKIPAVKLPSTSPANAAASLEKLTGAWSCINVNLPPC